MKDEQVIESVTLLDLLVVEASTSKHDKKIIEDVEGMPEPLLRTFTSWVKVLPLILRRL